MGQGNRSVIGTLVERATRYLMLLHLPGGRAAEQVRDALVREIGALPRQLARTLTWDQGSEMGRHDEFTLATGVPVYFCEPAKPWQRGSNENTNGLLRQYFPKGTDLSVHSVTDLAAVAAELNHRPRKVLGWATPADRFADLVATATWPRVATSTGIRPVICGPGAALVAWPVTGLFGPTRGLVWVRRWYDGECSLFAIGLDIRDPLTAALAGLLGPPTDVAVFASGEPRLADGPIHFEIATVLRGGSAIARLG